MTSPETTLTQLLAEAHAGEVALVSVLTEQIAMAPQGSLRDALERHLDETRSHAERIDERLGDLGEHRSRLESAGAAVYAAAELVVAQGLALAKTPLDLVRGHGGYEKALKNAKDACATEALEIATYDAIEQVAKSAGDDKTAKLAREIRADEERTLAKLREEIPALAAAVVGDATFKPSQTGAADGARKAAKTAARKTGASAPLPRYDELTVDEVIKRVGSDESKAKEVARYEKAHQNRKGVLEGIPA
jgi:ferritin-like metal-binding protein YciE